MNTNSTQETQIVKLNEKEYIFGNYDDKYDLFTLPVGHVVYTIEKAKDGRWVWGEEHVDNTEVQRNTIYNKMTIYTQEGNKYTWEVNAFMTVQGAVSACEAYERIDMQQRDIDHLNEIIDLKEMRPYPDD